jgi:hypothetical protein
MKGLRAAKALHGLGILQGWSWTLRSETLSALFSRDWRTAEGVLILHVR